MDYKIKDHGVWKPYTPDTMPEWHMQALAYGGVSIFLKREADGADYYEYRSNASTFTANSVVATTLHYPSREEEIVKSVFCDAHKAFPMNQRLIEIIGVDSDETKPHNLFAEMTYDPATQTLSGEPGLKHPEKTLKKDLWTRATDAEADQIEAWLTKQPARKQRLFNDTVVIDHADQLYTDLLDAFTTLFGADRATDLLKIS